MPRLLVVADLHHDRWAAARRDPLALMPPGWFGQFDMVILSGDVVDKPKVRLAPALEQIGRHIPLDRLQVFPGNHCFYDQVLDGEDRLARIVTTAGAHYAQGTLWGGYRPTRGSRALDVRLERGDEPRRSP
ncbi:metallophosphoesterase [Roseicyclus mahoneyensis]|uniref:Calcineurin-like phosphoesterase family protein n=1 Tax=Roseicyclus mahoneyensis TaxID=164332 RepID=A0A316GCR1_9RHOB|nr:metallophosphoesterase [Roseicyclus mahoneyensis]PWK58005.1 calcineurin-like phosphoesterase family protein [Roseicyclus mahoneyensis]